MPEIRKKAEEKGVELILPVDFVCSSKFGDDGEIQEGDMSTGVPRASWVSTLAQSPSP